MKSTKISVHAGRIYPESMPCRMCGAIVVRIKDGVWLTQSTRCDGCRKKKRMAHRKRGKALRKMRKHDNPTVTAESIVEHDVFCSQLWQCGICGERVPYDKPANHPLSAELDHIKPLCSHGTHTKDNVQCTHRLCNSIKSDMSQRDAILAVRAALKAYECRSVFELAEKYGLNVKAKLYRAYPAGQNP